MFRSQLECSNYLVSLKRAPRGRNSFELELPEQAPPRKKSSEERTPPGKNSSEGFVPRANLLDRIGPRCVGLLSSRGQSPRVTSAFLFSPLRGFSPWILAFFELAILSSSPIRCACSCEEVRLSSLRLFSTIRLEGQVCFFVFFFCSYVLLQCLPHY